MTCRRRNGMALVAALATLAVAATFAQAASARPLVSILSNTCLEPRSTFPILEQFLGGKPVHTANCAANTDSGPQNWVTTFTGTAPVRGRQGQFNVFVFSNLAGCLTSSGRLGDGGAVVAGSCASTGTLWTLGRSGFNGSVELVNAHSGKCLDVQGGFLGPDIKMIQWTCFPGHPFEGNLFHIPPL